MYIRTQCVQFTHSRYFSDKVGWLLGYKLNKHLKCTISITGNKVEEYGFVVLQINTARQVIFSTHPTHFTLVFIRVVFTLSRETKLGR